MRLLATACLCLLLLAACTGTTEARENPDLQPGSGDLGSGDVVEPTDGLDDAPTDDDLEVPMETTPPAAGALCNTGDAAREIRRVPSTLLLAGPTLDERRSVVQLGDSDEVAQRIREERRRAIDAGEPRVRAVDVTTVACADEAAATIAFRVARGDEIVHRTGSLMLIDGSWRFTLSAFCRLQEYASCAEIPGLDEQAAKLLSPSLRSRAAND